MRRVASDFLYTDRGALNLLASKEEGASNAPRLARQKAAMRAVVKERLTPVQQRYIMLYYYENKTMEEIGLTCGVHKSTVSRTLARARRTLAQYLQYCL